MVTGLRMACRQGSPGDLTGRQDIASLTPGYISLLAD